MGAYSNLAKVLSELDEASEVERAYIVKFGCVRLLEFDEPKLSCRFPLVEFENLSAPSAGRDVTGPKLHSEILKSLREHPNIFDITAITDKRDEITNSSQIGLLVIGNVFSLEVRLPERLQKWRQHWAEESTTAEEFHVISSGSLFAAFVEIEDYPARTNIGHEYRDLLQQQIRKASSLKSPHIGPSPIHPDFYIILRKKLAEEVPHGMKTYILRDDVFVVLDSEAGTIGEATVGLFRELEFPLFEFYDLQLGRIRLIAYNVEVFNHFSDLCSGVEQLHSISWWHWLQRGKLSSSAKKSLSHVHERLVESGVEYLDFSRTRTARLSRIKENPIIGESSEYFAQHTSPADVELPEALTPALSYFGQELQTLGNIRSTIIAAFLSALAGAFFYALISRFLSN